MRRLFVGLLCLGAAWAMSAGSAEAVQYKIRDLGALPKSEGSYALDINKSGQVVGWAWMPSGYRHACLWQDGKAIDLGTLPGTNNSYASSINNSGQIVGASFSAPYHACIWEGGTVKELSVDPGLSSSEALGINNLGQIVGDAWSATSTLNAYLWQGETVTPLDSGQPVAINDNGHAVGGPYLWRDGKQILLYASGVIISHAKDINNKEQIIGYSSVANGHNRALLWDNGRITNLGTLAGQSDSFALALNNNGQAVGYACNNTYGTMESSHALLWQNGSITDLGMLPGAYFSVANSINDNGVICGISGSAYGGGLVHAVLWEPVPEPSSIISLLCGIGGLSAIIKRKKNK